MPPKRDTEMKNDPSLFDRLRQTSERNKQTQDVMKELFPKKKKESQMGRFVDKRGGNS